MSDFDVPKAETASGQGIESRQKSRGAADVNPRPAKSRDLDIFNADEVELGGSSLIESHDAKPLILGSIVADNDQVANYHTANIPDEDARPQPRVNHRAAVVKGTEGDGPLRVGAHALVQDQVSFKPLPSLE